jgi:hypothetical protein
MIHQTWALGAGALPSVVLRDEGIRGLPRLSQNLHSTAHVEIANVAVFAGRLAGLVLVGALAAGLLARLARVGLIVAGRGVGAVVGVD